MPDADAIIQSLQQDDREVPWPALEAAAAALVAAPSLMDSLSSAFREHLELENRIDVPRFTTLYVSAVLAMAAPRLAEPDRQTVCRWLVSQLARSDPHEFGDVELNALESALASIGPVVVPFIAETLSGLCEENIGWYPLILVAQSFIGQADPAALARIRDVAMNMLQQAADADPEADVTSAAGFLAAMRHEPARPLLEKLIAATQLKDYVIALKALSGESELRPGTEYKPLREWVEEEWRLERNWFDRPPDRHPLGGGGDDADDDYGPDAGYTPHSESSTIRRTEPKIGPNDPCPCGSGKKHKKCCGRR